MQGTHHLGIQAHFAALRLSKGGRLNV